MRFRLLLGAVFGLAAVSLAIARITRDYVVSRQ
jgi:hypothetical protein